jgi:kynurenine formamidase
MRELRIEAVEFGRPPRHTGHCLLRAGIPQLQVLTNLDRLAGHEAYIAAFPLRLVGGTGSPLRAFAVLA